MGIRETQPMGLPKEANNFLAENSKVANHCEHCGRNDGYVRRRIGSTGMFDDLGIYEYELKDSRVACEFVQETVWSSGPMIWMGLRVGDREFLWPKEAYEGYEG